MGKSKQAEIAYEHIRTEILIKVSKVCTECPYRIFAKDMDVVTFGTGNISSNFIFVLPTYDHQSKVGYANLLSALSIAYDNVIGRSIFQDAYVTRLVKCNKNIGHDLYTSCVAPCSNFFAYEVGRLPAKHIIFFGSSFDDYNNNSDTVGLNLSYKTIYKVYSPAVLFYDNDKLKNKLFEDLFAILNNN